MSKSNLCAAQQFKHNSIKEKNFKIFQLSDVTYTPRNSSSFRANLEAKNN